jgi:hypothetical protein
VSAALIIALINASPAVIAAVEKIIADITASGHPDTADLKPEHVAAISAALRQAAPSTDVPAPLANPDGPE